MVNQRNVQRVLCLGGTKVTVVRPSVSFISYTPPIFTSLGTVFGLPSLSVALAALERDAGNEYCHN